jgi:hypothetical protein
MPSKAIITNTLGTLLLGSLFISGNLIQLVSTFGQNCRFDKSSQIIASLTTAPVSKGCPKNEACVYTYSDLNAKESKKGEMSFGGGFVWPSIPEPLRYSSSRKEEEDDEESVGVLGTDESGSEVEISRGLNYGSLERRSKKDRSRQAKAYNANNDINSKKKKKKKKPQPTPQPQPPVDTDPKTPLPKPQPPVKIVFVGDQGLGKDPTRVLKRIEKWGAELIVQLGDFDYEDNPQAFMKMYDDAIGKQPPMVAVVGNHDVLKWYWPNGYRDRLVERLKYWHGAECSGEYGVNMVCVWKGMVS